MRIAREEELDHGNPAKDIYHVAYSCVADINAL